MKESRFIELLNLYVDHQIGPAEAAELQDEVNSNPARRRLYRQYCQMQKACSILGDRAREEAPASFALESALLARVDDGSERVVALPVRRSRRWLPLAAAGAMAACVAVVLVRNEVPSATSSSPMIADIAPAPATPAMVVANTPSEPVSPAALQVEPRRYASGAFISRTVAFAPDSDGVQDLSGATETPALDWIASVKLAPVHTALAEDLEFEAKPALRPDVRAFQSARQMAPLTGEAAEFVAFKFQR